MIEVTALALVTVSLVGLAIVVLTEPECRALARALPQRIASALRRRGEPCQEPLTRD